MNKQISYTRGEIGEVRIVEDFLPGSGKQGFKAGARVAELCEGIARGEKAVAEGRTLSQAQVRHRLAKWLK